MRDQGQILHWNAGALSRYHNFDIIACTMNFTKAYIQLQISYKFLIIDDFLRLYIVFRLFWMIKHLKFCWKVMVLTLSSIQNFFCGNLKNEYPVPMNLENLKVKIWKWLDHKAVLLSLNFHIMCLLIISILTYSLFINPFMSILIGNSV